MFSFCSLLMLLFCDVVASFDCHVSLTRIKLLKLVHRCALYLIPVLFVWTRWKRNSSFLSIPHLIQWQCVSTLQASSGMQTFTNVFASRVQVLVHIIYIFLLARICMSCYIFLMLWLMFPDLDYTCLAYLDRTQTYNEKTFYKAWTKVRTGRMSFMLLLCCFRDETATEMSRQFSA